MSAANTPSTRVRTSSRTSGSLSGPTASSTRPRSKTTSCWRAATTDAGIIPSAASVPVYFPLE
eukprot:6206058-Pleurochrysis_carterae.AAC.1